VKERVGGGGGRRGWKREGEIKREKERGRRIGEEEEEEERGRDEMDWKQVG